MQQAVVRVRGAGEKLRDDCGAQKCGDGICCRSLQSCRLRRCDLRGQRSRASVCDGKRRRREPWLVESKTGPRKQSEGYTARERERDG
jgi:hypothetical protein